MMNTPTFQSIDTGPTVGSSHRLIKNHPQLPNPKKTAGSTVTKIPYQNTEKNTKPKHPKKKRPGKIGKTPHLRWCLGLPEVSRKGTGFLTATEVNAMASDEERRRGRRWKDPRKKVFWCKSRVIVGCHYLCNLLNISNIACKGGCELMCLPCLPSNLRAVLCSASSCSLVHAGTESKPRSKEHLAPKICLFEWPCFCLDLYDATRVYNIVQPPCLVDQSSTLFSLTVAGRLWGWFWGRIRRAAPHSTRWKKGWPWVLTGGSLEDLKWKETADL